MSRSVLGPNVTASMIHEVRMVFESFFRNRSYNSLFSPRPESTAMKCISCIRTGNSRPKNAIAIKDGQSVCQLHALS